MADVVGFLAIYLLITFAFVALPVGLIKPQWISKVIRRKFTRKKALLIFGSGLVISGAQVSSLIPSPVLNPPTASETSDANGSQEEYSGIRVKSTTLASDNDDADDQTLSLRTEEVTDTDNVSFIEEHVYNVEMAEGATRVVQEGVNGIITKVYRVTYQGSTEVKRELVSAKTTQEPINKITMHGTKKATQRTIGASGECDANYSGVCVPIAEDVDCEGSGGSGPFVRGPVTIIGNDIYGLDDNDDGVGC